MVRTGAKPVEKIVFMNTAIDGFSLDTWTKVERIGDESLENFYHKKSELDNDSYPNHEQMIHSICRKGQRADLNKQPAMDSGKNTR